MAVVLDPVLAEVLACPAPDHGSLRVGTPEDPTADALTCESCGRIYPVEDGIPVLLLDEAVNPGEAAAPGGTATPDTDGGAESPLT